MNKLLWILLLMPGMAWADSCLVTAGSPSYTSGTQSMSCDQSANLRTVTTPASGSVQDVNDKTTNGVTTQVGAGAVGTGSKRVAVGQDTTTIAGSAPGTAAAPSTNLVSEVPIPSSGSAAGLAPVVSTTTESSHVLKASAGNLYGVCVTNGATAGYVLLFNATSAPVDGAVTPVGWIQMPATNDTACYDPGAVPDYYATGITAVYSTTGPFTKTASATAAFAGKVK